MEIKNGTQIDGVLKSIEIEWVNSNETSETINLVWADLDAQFIGDLVRFLIRRANE